MPGLEQPNLAREGAVENLDALGPLWYSRRYESPQFVHLIPCRCY